MPTLRGGALAARAPRDASAAARERTDAPAVAAAEVGAARARRLERLEPRRRAPRVRRSAQDELAALVSLDAHGATLARVEADGRAHAATLSAPTPPPTPSAAAAITSGSVDTGAPSSTASDGASSESDLKRKRQPPRSTANRRFHAAERRARVALLHRRVAVGAGRERRRADVDVGAEPDWRSASARPRAPAATRPRRAARRRCRSPRTRPPRARRPARPRGCRCRRR